MVMWLWVGGVLTAFGALLAAVPSGRKRRAGRRADSEGGMPLSAGHDAGVPSADAAAGAVDGEAGAGRGVRGPPGNRSGWPNEPAFPGGPLVGPRCRRRRVSLVAVLATRPPASMVMADSPLVGQGGPTDRGEELQRGDGLADLDARALGGRQLLRLLV